MIHKATLKVSCNSYLHNNTYESNNQSSCKCNLLPEISFRTLTTGWVTNTLVSLYISRKEIDIKSKFIIKTWLCSGSIWYHVQMYSPVEYKSLAQCSLHSRVLLINWNEKPCWCYGKRVKFYDVNNFFWYR